MRRPDGHDVKAGSAESIGWARFRDDVVIVAENLHDLGGGFAFFGHFVPELHRRFLDHFPFVLRYGCQLQLFTGRAQTRLAAPVPLVAVGVAGLDRRVHDLLEVIRQLCPISRR